MSRVNYRASFALAKTPDYNKTQLANGAIVLDTLDEIGGQEAIQVKLDGYFSVKGLEDLIGHLEVLKSRLTYRG